MIIYLLSFVHHTNCRFSTYFFCFEESVDSLLKANHPCVKTINSNRIARIYLHKYRGVINLKIPIIFFEAYSDLFKAIFYALSSRRSTWISEGEDEEKIFSHICSKHAHDLTHCVLDFSCDTGVTRFKHIENQV
jgi:hypothetical protein